MKKYILALDQGTTSSRAILFDKSGVAVAKAQKEFKQIYPKPGWVEHNPEEIWLSQLEVAKEVIIIAGISSDEISAIGITNQRETTVVWDKKTGVPVYNAIVWQCRRTSGFCDNLILKGLEKVIQKKTGLVVDAYFSGSKIRWILDNVDGARDRAERGELIFGTIDTWLIWKLTAGNVHATDYSNASRTMLFNIYELKWDIEITKEFGIPIKMLPKVQSSSSKFGVTASEFFGTEIQITGVAGDQQAALFGQGCFEAGMVKNTYGTGCFMLMNTGSKQVISKNGLLTTIAWGIDGKVVYALEGSIFMAGAVIQWLRDEMKLISDASETEKIAESVEDSNGVYIIPAFSGMGAPFWDMYARGTVVGLTRGANRAHFVRAALEAIAYQTRDVLEAMQDDSGIELMTLKVDGGAVQNNFLMQFQADILGVKVEKPINSESTAFGAACLAGLASGFWGNRDGLFSFIKAEKVFNPNMALGIREEKYKGWKRAVERSLNWIEQ